MIDRIEQNKQRHLSMATMGLLGWEISRKQCGSPDLCTVLRAAGQEGPPLD